MKKASTVLVIVLLLAACGRSGVRKGQHDYEVVQEGTATGVTSTIQGPGETVPPITNTDYDATTAFTIDPNIATGGSAPTPGSIAGTLPQAAPPMSGMPTPVIARPAQPITRPSAPPPMTTQPRPPVPTQTDPPPEPEEPSTQTDTAPPPPPTNTAPPPPSQTDTVAPPSTDTTATPPAEKPPLH